jgi:hypothetical protein
MKINEHCVDSNFSKRQIFSISLALFCASFCLRWLYPGSRIGIDDANIFFSYANNLASGHGVSYGAQLERVEGYTSTLWMLICALSFWLKTNEAGIFVVSNLLTTATLTIAIVVLKRCQVHLSSQQTGSYGVLFFLMVLSNPSYLLWMLLSLMDSALWGCILMCMFSVILIPPKTTGWKVWLIYGTPFVISGLARPEAMVITPLFLCLLLLSLRRHQIKKSVQITCGVFAAFLVVIILLTTFRIFYFGYPLPSTYYAKVSPSLLHNVAIGWTYALNFLSSNIAVAVGLLASALLFYSKFENSRLSKFSYKPDSVGESTSPAYFFLPAIGLLVLLPVLTGGDHFSLFRFYQPLYPILLLAALCLPLTISLDALWKRSQSRPEIHLKTKLMYLTIFGVWAGCLLNSPSWLTIGANPARPLLNEFSIANAGRAQGSSINRLFTDHPQLLPKVGVIVAGGIAMTYKGPVIDMMGLNNSYVAHFPGDRTGPKNHAAFEKDAFFNLEIDYVKENPNDWFLVQAYLKNLFYDERFFNNWKWGVLRTKKENSHTIEGFFHSRYIEKALSSGDYVFTETLFLDKKNWTGRWLKSQ